MERKLVSEEELLSILNKEFLKYKECENRRFHSILKLAEEDKDGCNWSSVNVVVRCSGVPAEICSPFASRIVSEIRKEYNINK